MKIHKYLALVFSVLLLLNISCDEEEPSDDTLTMADIEGSWIATSAVFTNNSNTEQTIDMVALGGEIRITAFADGRTRTWVELESYSDEWDALATISGDILTSTPIEDSRPVSTFKFTLEDNTLTLTNDSDEFDFGGSNPISATSVTTFVRND